MLKKATVNHHEQEHIELLKAVRGECNFL